MVDGWHAILCAGADGYGRLMGVDESGTLTTLKAHLHLIGSLSEKHGGRVMAIHGDTLLAGFDSMVDLKAGEKVKLDSFKVDDKVYVKYADGTASSVKGVKATGRGGSKTAGVLFVSCFPPP